MFAFRLGREHHRDPIVHGIMSLTPVTDQLSSNCANRCVVHWTGEQANEPRLDTGSSGRGREPEGPLRLGKFPAFRHDRAQPAG